MSARYRSYDDWKLASPDDDRDDEFEDRDEELERPEPTEEEYAELELARLEAARKPKACPIVRSREPVVIDEALPF